MYVPAEISSTVSKQIQPQLRLLDFPLFHTVFAEKCLLQISVFSSSAAAVRAPLPSVSCCVCLQTSGCSWPLSQGGI